MSGTLCRALSGYYACLSRVAENTGPGLTIAQHTALSLHCRDIAFLDQTNGGTWAKESLHHAAEARRLEAASRA